MKHKRYQRGQFIIKWNSCYEKWQVCYMGKPLEEFRQLEDALLWASTNKIGIKYEL
jgi:hypothetical protein